MLFLTYHRYSLSCHEMTTSFPSRCTQKRIFFLKRKMPRQCKVNMPSFYFYYSQKPTFSLKLYQLPKLTSTAMWYGKCLNAFKAPQPSRRCDAYTLLQHCPLSYTWIVRLHFLTIIMNIKWSKGSSNCIFTVWMYKSGVSMEMSTHRSK